MMVVGITGGIGSGKTVVCNVFSNLGVPVYDADREAKKIYFDEAVKEEVKKKFGGGYFNVDGELDRKKFADLVFHDRAALENINRIIHPHVKKSFKEWKKLHPEAPYVLEEAAILFESGSWKGCEKIITVTAPEELRIQRVMNRDHRPKEQVLQIISRQWTDEEKIKRSDFVIENDDRHLVLPKVIQIHKHLMGLKMEAGN